MVLKEKWNKYRVGRQAETVQVRGNAFKTLVETARQRISEAAGARTCPAQDGAMRIMTRQLVAVSTLLAAAAAQTTPLAAKQNPSPMVDNTRAHKQVARIELRGNRIPLSLGTLFIPDRARNHSRISLIIHFHGATWLAEQSATQFDARAAVLTVNLGAGSGIYSQAFADPTRFRTLLTEASGAVSPPGTMRFDAVVLTSFSAGYGAVREILKNRDNWPLIDGVVLVDSLHTGYLPDGTPGQIGRAHV